MLRQQPLVPERISRVPLCCIGQQRERLRRMNRRRDFLGHNHSPTQAKEAWVGRQVRFSPAGNQSIGFQKPHNLTRTYRRSP